MLHVSGSHGRIHACVKVAPVENNSKKPQDSCQDSWLQKSDLAEP